MGHRLLEVRFLLQTTMETALPDHLFHIGLLADALIGYHLALFLIQPPPPPHTVESGAPSQH
jgi:quinol-cytochrome oxidoreductase complex cytochrome b subunit